MRADEILVVHKTGTLIYAFSRYRTSPEDYQYRATRLLALLDTMRASWGGSVNIQRLSFGAVDVFLVRGERIALVVAVEHKRSSAAEALVPRVVRTIEERFGEELDRPPLGPDSLRALETLLDPLRRK